MQWTHPGLLLSSRGPQAYTVGLRLLSSGYPQFSAVGVHALLSIMTLNTSTLNNSAHSANSGPLEPVRVEAYSVVLSTAALALAVVLGGGGSLTLLLAIFQSRRVRKYSYTLVLVFFFLCCGLDLLWSPMELAHLLSYHHSLQNPTRDFAVATFAIYIFLLAGLAILITAFCAENVLRLSGMFSPVLRHAWPLSVCLSMLLLCLLMALAFLATSLHTPSPHHPLSYLVLHAASSATRVTILTLLVLMVVLGAVAVVLAGVVAIRMGGVAVKTSESFLSGQSNDSNALPRFIVNQTGAGASNEDVDKISMSASSSKLPDIIGPDVTPATPVKGPGKLADLSAPAPRGPTMLGVNMSQVLGRRRHTICQIGDSSAPADPINKAKTYNYVRKFSVDISALQAQLENPKLFKDMLPFSSHQDLSQKQKQQEEADKPPEPRAPLLPLQDFKKPEVPDSPGGGLTLSVPPRPPVITVSEEVREDVEGEIEEEEREGEGEKGGCVNKDLNFSAAPGAEYPVDKMNLTDIPRLPVTQPVDEEDEEEDDDAEKRAGGNPCGEEEEEEDMSYKSNNRLSDRDQDFIKMTLLMTLTFFLCTFPLFLIEAMKGGVTPHTYVNVSTCARALSVIQTIIYPHIVICMDGVVHRAVQRLKQRISRACSFRDRDDGGMEVPPEQASSNTSQM
ncbi:hypothetical protein ACOMHN_014215 [Nucella lapillus]